MVYIFQLLRSFEKFFLFLEFKIKYQTDYNNTPHVKMSKRGKLKVGTVPENHASFIVIF